MSSRIDQRACRQADHCHRRNDRYSVRMRLRFPELLDERQMTAYALSHASGDRISMSTAYRLMRRQGRVQFVDMQLLDTLCDTLRVGPAELFEREKTAHSKRGRSERL